MKPSLSRKLLFAYIALMLLVGAGYAKWDSYQLDGDAVSFMDIGDAMLQGNWPLVANGYWNPAYAGALAIGKAVAHPTRFTELQTFYWVNWFIFAAAVGVTIYFVLSLGKLRDALAPDDEAALSPTAIIFAALGLLFFSMQRELSIGKVRSDLLLYVFLFLGASFLLRLQATQRFFYYPLLGVALGFAYLTKSYAFLPSGFLMLCIFFFGLTRKGKTRTQVLAGIVTTGVIFLAIAAPYIIAISKQRGRITTGESARLNYAFFVDQTPRWHEWVKNDLGHATANFKHHEEMVLASPHVYSFTKHPYGTYPLWFDPAYWTDTLIPHVWLKGQIIRLVRCTELMTRYLLGHAEPLVLLAVLLLTGAAFRRNRAAWLPYAPIILWGVVMLGIYFPVDLQDRYMTFAYFFIVIPPLAMLRKPANSTQAFATAAVMVLALVSLADGTRDMLERRRVGSATGYKSGAYSKQIFPAAHGLNDMGVKPGDKVACLGDDACYVDHYWARLAGASIIAEVEVPEDGNPREFLAKLPNQDEVAAAAKSQGAVAIVAVFRSGMDRPSGWQQLGTSDFYALPLR